MFLILHGQTEWNRDGKLQGHADSPLTDEGRRQVQNATQILASQLPNAKTVRIIASPLGRTLATARIVAAALGISPDTITTDYRLAEIRLGLWEGLTREEIRAGWPERMTSSTRNGWFFQSPNGEDYDSVSDRLCEWLSDTDEQEGLIAVSHGVASRVLRGLYAKLPKDMAIDLNVTRDAPVRLIDGRMETLG